MLRIPRPLSHGRGCRRAQPPVGEGTGPPATPRTSPSAPRPRSFLLSPPCPRNGNNLWILDLKSGATEEAVVAPPKLVEPFLTSQCFSPDGKEFVYWLNTPEGEIRIYDSATKKSHKLAAGTSPTWSPDGNWIAFLSDAGFFGDAYFAVRPSGDEKKKLVRTTEGYCGLYWSPDSRFAAYWSSMSISEIIHSFGWKGLLYFSVFRLRVMRLNDHSEDWVLENESMWDYQWVTNKALSPH
jgi:WD40 repeat protein